MDQQWRPDSTFSQNAGFLATSILNGIANQAINAGELCTLFESGVIRRTDPTLPWSAINQNPSVAPPIQPAAPVVNITQTGMTVAKATGYPARLLNLTYAIPMQTSAGIGLAFASSSGQQVTNFVLVSSDNSNAIPYCVPLQTGNVAIIWHVGASLKFAIFSPQGEQVVAAVTVATSVYVAGAVPWHGHGCLGNGNLVLSWCTTAGALQSQVFNPATGATVTSVTTIDTSINGGLHGLVPCANGDFLVICFDSSHNLHKLYRLLNANTLSWGPKSPSTATAIFSQPDGPRQFPVHNRICELGNGNIVLMLPASSSDTYANCFLLNNLGVLQLQLDFGNLFHDAGVGNPLILTNNGFCVAHYNNATPNTYASFYDYNGNCLQQNVLVDGGAYAAPTGSSPTVNGYLGYTGSTVCFVRYTNVNGGVEVRQMHFDHRGVLVPPGPPGPGQAPLPPLPPPPNAPPGFPLTWINNPIEHQPFTPGGDCNAPVPNCDLDGMTFLYFFSVATTQPVAASASVGASSVIGVAQAAAAAGAAVTIVAAGYFQLPSTQIFGNGQSFDQRNASVPGCRGTVGGQIAVLFGWV